MLDAIKNKMGCAVLWGGGKDEETYYGKRKGQIQLLVSYERGFMLELPWKFSVVQGVGRCLWGSALPCAKHSFPHTLSSPLGVMWPFGDLQKPVHPIWSHAKRIGPVVSSQVGPIYVAMPLPAIFWGVLGPGLSFLYKAFLAEPLLLGTLKDLGRLLGIISEEGQWGEGKTYRVFISKCWHFPAEGNLDFWPCSCPGFNRRRKVKSVIT